MGKLTSLGGTANIRQRRLIGVWSRYHGGNRRERGKALENKGGTSRLVSAEISEEDKSTPKEL